MTGIVYCTTNLVNGKKYIGQTTSSNPRYLGSNKHLGNAVRKYGLSNFTREILQDNIPIEFLNESEIYWIDYFGADKSDLFYNITKGGEGNPNLWVHRKGIKNTLDHNKKISESVKNSYSTGRRCMSTEHKAAISLANKGRIWSKKSIDKLIETKKKNGTIGKGCFGKRSKEVYESFITKYRETTKGKLKDHARCVLQFDLEGNFIKEYQSILQAAKLNSLLPAGICSCCGGRSKFYRGFVWRYKDGLPPNNKYNRKK